MALSEDCTKSTILLASYRSVAEKIELTVKDFLSDESLRVVSGLCAKIHCSSEVLC